MEINKKIACCLINDFIRSGYNDASKLLEQKYKLFNIKINKYNYCGGRGNDGKYQKCQKCQEECISMENIIDFIINNRIAEGVNRSIIKRRILYFLLVN